MLEAIGKALLEYGGLGVAVAALLFMFDRKDKALQAECAARIADAKEFRGVMLAMQERTLMAIDKIAENTTAITELLNANNPRRSRHEP